MRAFIVRPFGTKNSINFDQVEKDLIAPALDAAGITGRTTAEIMAPGNIREDMFQLLLTADVVVADITLHNANVYYELGIRHALRDRITIMLRGVGGDDGLAPDAVPFDLLTDRYLTYPLGRPAEALPALTAAIQQGKESHGRDSPVFKLLPKLTAPSPDDFLAVPRGFEEAVERCAGRVAGTKEQEARTLLTGDLALLAHEARFFPWAGAGLRLVGRKQFQGNHHRGAKLTWEGIRKRDPLDLEANTLLCTIYQKLGDLTASNAAADRVLARPELTLHQRAELHALHASNLKTEWLASIADTPTDQRGEAALESGLLAEAIEAYEAGFKADRNHYYSGINALALRVVQRELATRLPRVWELTAADAMAANPAEEAVRKLDEIKERIQRLAAGVALALESAATFDKPENAVWRSFTRVDLFCLTCDDPKRVGLFYRQMVERFRTTDAFALSSARAQLLLLQKAGVLLENAEAGLTTFGPLPPEPAKDKRRILLFTGHRIDDADRTAKGMPPRFPRTPEAEAAARQAIAERVERTRASPQGVAFGLAGGASGGDILFQEACMASGIPTWLYLALPPARYKNESVRGAGDGWVRRFEDLEHRLSDRTRLMCELHGETEELPGWLAVRQDYDIWQRNNLWMLQNALAFGPDRVTLIALWDGQESGDGPGGTAHLVDLARRHGAEVDVVDTKTLFGLT